MLEMIINATLSINTRCSKCSDRASNSNLDSSRKLSKGYASTSLFAASFNVNVSDIDRSQLCTHCHSPNPKVPLKKRLFQACGSCKEVFIRMFKGSPPHPSSQ